MTKKESRGSRTFLIVWLALIIALLAAIVLTWHPAEHTETVKEVMRDGVLHESNKVSLFGLTVNPALLSAVVVSSVLLICAALIRIFAVPRLRDIPGKWQSLLEMPVEFFSNMARTNSPNKSSVAGAYIFSAGLYIFVSTLFELLGIQALTTGGASISLPAPIADINAAIAMGVTSYLFILLAGFLTGGLRGGLSVLKDFSLPISMSFRLFGALLSGLLVTELVYYYVSLSFVLPVFVGVMFTLLHALIQTYVLTTLVSIFFGEATEIRPGKNKEKKGKKS